MTEFTPEWIAGARKVVGNDVASVSGQIAFIVLDEIERLQQHIAELKQERAGILTVLDEVIGEAQLQDPFSDASGEAILRGAKILLEKMQPQPPKEVTK